ncbi:hypothetical protein ACNS7O_04540 [Haloferacaceae archaeon DSL9]
MSEDAARVTETRSFRGISQRLAVHYLRNLGGEPASDGEPIEGEIADEAVDEVVGDGWRARLSSEVVSVAGSIELTEVEISFEGEKSTVEPVIERFARKAMRAGG